MFVLGNLLITIGRLLNFAIGVYIWLIIIRALLSWFNPDPFNKFVQLLNDITDPVLRPVRRLLPLNLGFDISPIIVIILLYFTQSFIARTIIDLGVRLR